MKIAVEVSSWSKDPSTKVGCVVVQGRTIVSTGYNGFPWTVNDEKFFESSYTDNDRRKLTVHAEVNACINMQNSSLLHNGLLTFYCTHKPCWDCLKYLSCFPGIYKVIYNKSVTSSGYDWNEGDLEEWLNSDIIMKWFEDYGKKE